MDFIREFRDISRSDTPTAGGKGASLGEMTQAGIPVPPGFVILSGAFEHFLEETDLHPEIDAALHAVDHSEMHTIERASEKIRALIIAAPMPDIIAKSINQFHKELGAAQVAVRSSATAEDSASAAWAGQLESFLNTTDETLLENVQKCWASLFTPRAIFYRFEKNLHMQKISVAVVVQKMVESEYSGIAFSVHPVTEDRNQLIIEAGFGLGEAIVSGSVTPDSYVVEKEPCRIIDMNINTQTRALYRAPSGAGNEWREILEPKASSRVLSEPQILELTELILLIENHYGFPCDIEWAFENGRFYITQSRPITTLSDKNKIPSKRRLELFGFRDFTLALSQLAFETESGPLPYLDNVNLKRPYFVGERKEGIIGFFIDKSQVDWQKREILKRIETEGKYVEKIIDRFEHEYAKIETFLDKGEPLSREDLPGFLADVRLAWIDAAGWWWSVEALEQASLYPKLVEDIMRVRRKSEKFVPSVDRIMRATIKKLYPQSIDFVEVISLDEVLSGRLPEEKILKERLEHYATIDGEVSVGADIEKAKDNAGIELILPDIKAHQGGVLKGDISYRGKYTGRVSTVLTKKDADVFKKGDVLVASTTIPNFIHAIRRAGAIVADEGGIMSHAAISSREFKIPAVIGTKIATQVLKDGDLVEVDADKGIVHMLGRAK